MIVIRPAAQHDIYSLTTLGGDEPLHQERLADQEEGRSVCLVAADETPEHHRVSSSVVGVTVLVWAGDEYHIGYPLLTNLLVRGPYRNHGIGTRLVEHAEWLCRERAQTHIGLSISPDANPRAYALYLRLGYRPTEAAPHCVVCSQQDEEQNLQLLEEWRICMVKNLNPTDTRVSAL